jgi:hypothetical protein
MDANVRRFASGLRDFAGPRRQFYRQRCLWSLDNYETYRLFHVICGSFLSAYICVHFTPEDFGAAVLRSLRSLSSFAAIRIACLAFAPLRLCVRLLFS